MICVDVSRDPLPLSVVHIPLCVSFAFFDSGKFMLIDPTQREQLVADGAVTVSMNKHREICMLETSGCLLLTLEQVDPLHVLIVLCLNSYQTCCTNLVPFFHKFLDIVEYLFNSCEHVYLPNKAVRQT